MATIRQLIQTIPATANALFAKLVDTSASAVKTRERLFGELKEELEMLANLEEQHFFPVLRKHKELKALVRDASAGNKATRKLLAKLGNTPRDSDEFETRVAELRKAFQQHVRDEKNELLPAIREALTNEDAKGVVERIETQLAEIADTKRAEADERRAEARGEREKLDAQQAKLKEARRAEGQQRRAVARQAREAAEQMQAAPDLTMTEPEDARPSSQRTAAVAQRALHEDIGTTTTLMSGAGEQAEHAFSAIRQQNQSIVSQATQTVQLLMGSRIPLAANIQEVTASYFNVSHKRLETNLAGIASIFASRTLSELFAAQAALIRNHVKLTFANRE